MSETTSTPHPQDRDDASQEHEGTFVGGEFGHSDNTEDGHLTTAQQVGADREEEAHLADPDQSAAATPESVTDPSGEQTLAGSPAGAGSFGADAEGTGTEPAPGDRNEPV